MNLREIPSPAVRPNEVAIKVGAVGLCGTDFHIYEGHANYNLDKTGRAIPLEEQPLILGHEFCGTVVEAGGGVTDLKAGDRVIVDQGLNCYSYGKQELCEYCATGNTHQCLNYAEHGITGLQGALADFIAVPGTNAVKIESDLPFEQAVLSEPLGCVTHACEMTLKTPARYQFNGERPIKAVLVCGAGPAGLLFTQYVRNVIGFDGLLIVSEPSSLRRKIAESYGATAIDPTAVDLVEAVDDLTRGERIQYLIESSGYGPLFKQIPALIRKQATITLYGHGHHGVDIGVLSNVQFIEPTIVAPTGASGGFDADHRPSVYRRSLELINSGKINVSKFITNRYDALDKVPQGFAVDRLEKDYIKGLAVLT